MWTLSPDYDLFLPDPKQLDLAPFGGKHGFSLDITLSCGQIFSWTNIGSVWLGVIDDSEVSVYQQGTCLFYTGVSEERIISYFGLNHPIDEILKDIMRSIRAYSGCNIPLIDTIFVSSRGDNEFKRDLTSSSGLRIVHQDPWECLAGYILSTNSNISIIRKRFLLLSQAFGLPVGNNGLFIFPQPDVLAGADLSSITACKTGYRAPYLLETAEIIADNPEFLDQIATLSYQKAKKQLMTLPGVGPKVADCVLLFAYQRYEAVPIDVWIRTIVTKRYLSGLSTESDDFVKKYEKKITYNDMAVFCRKYFGRYAGYAQQFIYAARDGKKNK